MGVKVVCHRSLQPSHLVIVYCWQKWWRISGSFQLSSFHVLCRNNNLFDMWDFHLLVNFRKLLRKRMPLQCLYWYKAMVLLKWLPWKPRSIIWQILVVSRGFFKLRLFTGCAFCFVSLKKKKKSLKMAWNVVCKPNGFVKVITKLSWPLRGCNKGVGRVHLPPHTKSNLVQ